LKFRQNQPTGGQSRESGIKRRETGGNKVGIDEMHDARLLGEELARKGGLSRPVWTGNDDTARLWVQMDGVFHQERQMLGTGKESMWVWECVGGMRKAES